MGHGSAMAFVMMWFRRLKTPEVASFTSRPSPVPVVGSIGAFRHWFGIGAAAARSEYFAIDPQRPLGLTTDMGAMLFLPVRGQAQRFRHTLLARQAFVALRAVVGGGSAPSCLIKSRVTMPSR